MKHLKERLAAAVNEAQFDFKYDDVRGDGSRKRRSHRGLSAPELASVYESQRHRAGSKRADCLLSDGIMHPLIAEVRNALADFIDPESDHLGHAFPIDSCSVIRNTGGEGGVAHLEFESTLEKFSESLLRAAAIMGVENVTKLLSDWKHGESIRFKTSTIVNGLVLDNRYCPRDDIEIAALPLTTAALPLTTAELPRLPDLSRRSPADYLGRTVLSLKMSASPVLFRPRADANGATVITRTGKEIDFDTVCDALSLQVNSHVSTTFQWTEHVEAAPFSMRDWGTIGGDTLDHLGWKSRHLDPHKGIVSIKLDNASIAQLDEANLLHAIEALRGGDRKLRIAVDRWKRSKRPYSPATDRYIDLRIALETLYLKDFLNEQSAEMRFRLSLFGAWHLGTTLEERREIRKALRDAYDKASGAVHGEEVIQRQHADIVASAKYCVAKGF